MGKLCKKNTRCLQKNFVMKKKVALIFGVTGQDGSYLAYKLIKKNYEIIGITKNRRTQNLKQLDIIKKIKLIKFDYKNFQN